jgi:hypothetical protein
MKLFIKILKNLKAAMISVLFVIESGCPTEIQHLSAYSIVKRKRSKMISKSN